MKIDKKIIKELTDYLNEFNLTEIEYTDKDTKIKVSKSISSNGRHHPPQIFEVPPKNLALLEVK